VSFLNKYYTLERKKKKKRLTLWCIDVNNCAEACARTELR
jgi:hypothetical protein